MRERGRHTERTLPGVDMPALIWWSGAREDGFMWRETPKLSGWNRLGRVTFEGSPKAQSVWTVRQGEEGVPKGRPSWRGLGDLRRVGVRVWF